MKVLVAPSDAAGVREECGTGGTLFALELLAPSSLASSGEKYRNSAPGVIRLC